MKIYLCGSCGSTERTRMVKVAELLRSLEYDVYCPFELQIPNAWDISQEDWQKKYSKLTYKLFCIVIFSFLSLLGILARQALIGNLAMRTPVKFPPMYFKSLMHRPH